jgi:hypothetical protein
MFSFLRILHLCSILSSLPAICRIPSRSLCCRRPTILTFICTEFILANSQEQNKRKRDIWRLRMELSQLSVFDVTVWFSFLTLLSLFCPISFGPTGKYGTGISTSSTGKSETGFFTSSTGKFKTGFFTSIMNVHDSAILGNQTMINHYPTAKKSVLPK